MMKKKSVGSSKENSEVPPKKSGRYQRRSGGSLKDPDVKKIWSFSKRSGH